MPRPALDRPEPRLVRVPGRRAWYIRWTEPGTRRSRVVSTGCPHQGRDTPHPALDAAALQALDDLVTGLDDPGDDPTVAQVLETYRTARRRDGVMDPDRLDAAAKALTAGMGHTRVAAITDSVLARYAAGRVHARTGHPVAPATLRKELSVLVSAINLAARAARRRRPRPAWCDALPQIDLPADSQPREHILTRPQAAALLGACRHQHLRLFIALGLATGQRKTAILNLTWDRVDLGRALADFRTPGRALTKKRRGIAPLGDGLVNELRQARDAALSPYVIEWNAGPVGDIKKGFAGAARAAGLPWATPHVLKHTCISWLAEDGFSVDDAADMTQTDPRTVRRIYRKTNPAHLRPLAQSLDPTAFAPTPLAQTRRKTQKPPKKPRRNKALSTTKSTL